VNYYERYCGDYARDTGHLSLQEHGAYTVMLDTYYATETALPADYKALYRICRAMSGREQDAVRSVADQFFPVAEDGLRHNGRADKTIEKALKRINAAKGNGSLGGRPPKEPTGFLEENPPGLEQEPSGHIGTTTRPHVPEKSKALSGKPDLKAQATEILNFLNAKANKAFRPVDQTLKPIIARLRDGYSPDDIRAVVVAKCREWLPDPKMAYCVRPKTLFGAENFANYEGQLPQVSNDQAA
jgi:uncharacterized phage protein (TIGR02220 family)